MTSFGKVRILRFAWHDKLPNVRVVPALGDTAKHDKLNCDASLRHGTLKRFDVTRQTEDYK
jgi:hypothetical protein